MKADKMQKKQDMLYAYIQHHGLPSFRAHSVCITKTAEAASKLIDKSYIVVPNLNHKNNACISHHYNIENSPLRIIQLPSIDLRRWKFIPRVITEHGWFLVSSWIFAIQALFWIKKNNIDIVQTGDRELPLLLKLFKNKSRKPFLIYDVHFDFSQNRYDGPMEKKILDRINLFLVNCNFLKTKFIKQGINESKILVLPNGFEPNDYNRISPADSREKYKFPKDKYIVGFIGRFEVYGLEKGIKELIDAALLIKKKSIPICVVAIGGPTEYIDRYRKYANSLGFSQDEIIIRDYISPSEVGDVIASFDVCSLLYPPTSYYVEKMSPMKAIEYQAAQKCIIATDIPAIRDMLFENAYYPKEYSAIEIANTLAYIYSKQLHRKSFTYKPLSWLDRMKTIISKLEDIRLKKDKSQTYQNR